MTLPNSETLQTLADAYGFLGNSLLKPMTQTASVGLDPAFWLSFPTFDDGDVSVARATCVHFAEDAQQRMQAGEDMVECVSVEYTRLFVGPPSPAAAPWETMYRAPEVTVGFGQATFDMRELLRAAGLELHNENHQYEDHMGIELLYLSEQCRRLAVNDDDQEALASQVMTFIEDHPLSWVDAFTVRVAESFPDGYFVALLRLTSAILQRHHTLG